jgi:hypothetical protein
MLLLGIGEVEGVVLVRAGSLASTGPGLKMTVIGVIGQSTTGLVS